MIRLPGYLTTLCSVILFCSLYCYGSECDKYVIKSGVSTDPSACEYRDFDRQRPSTKCARLCSKRRKCTGVAVENDDTTTWCCFLRGASIDVEAGNNTLYHLEHVGTECLFGFDPDTTCSQCAKKRDFTAEYEILNSPGTFETLSFEVSFNGPLCSQFTGVGECGDITGQIIRETGSWNFATTGGSVVYNATLVDGAMVEGTKSGSCV